MTDDGEDQRVKGSGRREYDDANEKLDAHIRENDRRLRRFFVGAIVAFSIIGLACTASLIGFGIVLVELTDTRKDFTRSVCTAQNSRHDETVKTFNEAKEDAIKKHPEQKQAIDESVEANVRIINALVPIQDCEYLVDLSVGDATPTPAKTP